MKSFYFVKIHMNIIAGSEEQALRGHGFHT